jgi:hypothetical protein
MLTYAEVCMLTVRENAARKSTHTPRHTLYKPSAPTTTTHPPTHTTRMCGWVVAGAEHIMQDS